jgi:cell pole-organizing protein PopZ
VVRQVNQTVRQMKETYNVTDTPMKAHYQRQKKVEDEKTLAETVAKIKVKHAKQGHNGMTPSYCKGLRNLV